MLLLLQGVAVEIPTFKLATETGTHAIEGFTVIFKRQSEGERKKRLRKSMKSITKANRLQKILLAGDEDDNKGLDEVTDAIEKTDMAFEKQLFDDIVGWRGLFDLDGSEVEYDVKTKRELLSAVPFREAILGVWSAATGGVKPEIENEAVAKN